MNKAEVPSGFFNRELKLRIISAVILAALVLLITWVGGKTFSLLCAVVALVIFYEYCRICGSTFSVAMRLAGYAAILLVIVAYHSAALSQAYWIAGGGFAVLLVWELVIRRSAWACLGFAYAALPFLGMSELRGSEFAGLLPILVLFGCVWGADILAYVFGRTIGGPKLAPKISPKKTWSGFIGSLVGGVGLAVMVILVAGYSVTAAFALLVLILTITSQVGDLVESSLKRRFDVKDSSNLIPGHGGILDRIDGLIPASVMLWLLLEYVSNGSQSQSQLGVVFNAAFLAP